MPDNGLPKGWARTRLGEHLSAILGGGTPSRKVPAFWQGDIPWASVKDMKSRVLTATEESVSQAGVDSGATRVVPSGSIVLATRMAVGAVAVTDKPIAINQDLKALVPADGLYPQFLLHLMEYNGERLARQGTGTTVAGIRIDDVEMLPFLLPPPDEQRRIAEVLDSIDAAIEKTEAVIATTERLRSALLGELLTRGMPGWHTEWKKVPRIGTIPKCWEVVRLGDVLSAVDYGTNVLASDAPGGIAILGMKNIGDGEVRDGELSRGVLADKERTALLLQRGDILFNRTNSIDLVGKVAIVRDVAGDLSFASYLLRLRTDPRRADPWWLIGLLNHRATQKALRRMATKGASQANINPTSLRSLAVPLPAVEEQARIATVTESLRDRQVVERHLLRILQTSKARVASALLSGRFRV